MIMGWGAGAYCQIYKESTYGTFPPSPPSPLTIELSTDTAIFPRKIPFMRKIRSNRFGNRPHRNVSHRYQVQATLTTLLYPSQAQYLLDMALKLTSSELDSYSIRFYDTVEQTQWTGFKVKRLRLESAAETDEGEVKATLELWGQKRDANPAGWTTPADNLYPGDAAWAFVETDGILVLGSTRTLYNRFAIEVNNELDRTFDEKAYCTTCTYAGREITWEFDCQFNSASDRSAFEAQSALSGSIGFTRSSGTITLGFDFNDAVVMNDWNANLPLGKKGYQQIKLQSLVDSTATTDITYTVTP
jgi:hypothetical protein